MKRNLRISVIVCVGFLTLFSCKEIHEQKNPNNLLNQARIILGENETLSEKIGVIHNDAVISVMNDLIYDNGLQDIYELTTANTTQEEFNQMILNKIIDYLSMYFSDFYYYNNIDRNYEDIHDFLTNQVDINDIIDHENCSIFNNSSETFLIEKDSIDQACINYFEENSDLSGDISSILSNSGLSGDELNQLYCYGRVAISSSVLWKTNIETWAGDTPPPPAARFFMLDPITWNNPFTNVLNYVSKADKQGAVGGWLTGGPAGALEGATIGSVIDALWP